MSWEQTLRERLERHRHGDGDLPVSIKIRATSGCFDHGCCPAAWRIIDEAMREHRMEWDRQRGRPDFDYEHHESGPELLIYLAAATAGLTLAKSVIDLVTTIIKARSEGQKKGDRHHEPIELIVRGFDKDGKIFEEKVLRMDAGDEPTRAAIQKALVEGMKPHVVAKETKAKRTKSASKKKKK